MPLALASLLCAAPVPAGGEIASIDEPRAYGHVIGDLLTRDVLLVLPAGRMLDSDALPRPGRIDNWLELHSLSLAPQGGSVRLRLRYQVINIGAEVVTTELPAMNLPLRGGAPGEVAALPEWPLHLSPLTPSVAVARGALDALQPDIAPVRERIGPLLARLAGMGLLALLLASPWLLARWPQLAFWRRDAPFRAAWRDLRAPGALGTKDDDETLRRAFARLHAAFDASAGSAVFAQQLDALYAARPPLRRAAGEIDAFFAASRQAFFAPPGADGTARLSLAQLRALALVLARLEAARP